MTINPNLPLVSISCLAYNQEKYIAAALDGFLMQKTNFSFEVLIHDDASTDKTADIIRGYEKKYPEIIRPIYQTENQWIKGLKGSAVHNFPRAKGKYIALCEGDDYWTDPYKLQQQVDMLESKPDMVGCFHNTEERYEENINKSSYLFCDFPTARAISFNDLAVSNPIPTCSVMFKSFDVAQLPDWYKKTFMGDWTLHLINSLKGDFWYIPRVMAVHRLHSESTWMLQDQKRNEKLIIEAYQVMIDSDTFPDQQEALLKSMKHKFETKDNLIPRINRAIKRLLPFS